jgi:hypothetical protein
VERIGRGILLGICLVKMRNPRKNLRLSGLWSRSRFPNTVGQRCSRAGFCDNGNELLFRGRPSNYS